MKISFTTLGCPGWDMDTVCAKGRAYGYDGVDFRGLQGDLDITLLPAFTSGAAATRRKINDAGLAVAGIASSIRVCEADKQEANIEEAKRTIAVCHGLGCDNVRVFGGGDLSAFTRQQLAEVGLRNMEEILALDGADSLHWLFETHDNWIKSTDCRLLLDRIANPAFGALWDMGHTPRVGGESPQQTYAAIGPRVGYTHVKDAAYEPGHKLAMADGWRYVAPGTGQLPLAEAIALLKAHGYDGWLLFEHEKRWHPDLPEPEEMFPKFVAWVRPLIA
jgi:sugar phosphate isomerase/epimerase